MAASPIALMVGAASQTLFTTTISSLISHQSTISSLSSLQHNPTQSSRRSSTTPIPRAASTTTTTTSATTTAVATSSSAPPPPPPAISLSMSDLDPSNSSMITNLFHFSRIDEHNCTDSDDIHFSSSTKNSTSSPNCTSAWDGVSCWYQTLSGQEAVIPCFSNLNGINYDTTQNASRLCLPNGTWAERADYDRCKPLKMEQLPIEHLYTPSIYYIGYGLSLCALTVALWIFLYFKDLRCVRNTIHTNLMITYLLIAVCWITTDRLHSNPSQWSRKASCMIVILLTYLMGTNFFWMFVEGLYLYILVVKTFSIEFVKVQNYAFIGWGLPAVVVLVWTLTKVYFSRYESSVAECPWQVQDEFDYIYKVPILLVLVINIFFLGKIMWVLIIKLRSATSAESKQYRKAAKALLVLIPLLGVGYILVLVTPTHSTAKLVFQYLQAILVSTQGFTVAVLYCFCNGEVRNSVRHHFERFRLRRTLRYGGDYPATQSTYYRSTAYLPQMHHHQSGNSTGHRASYAFRSLKNNSQNNSTGNGNGTNGRFSNASDTAAVRLYRSTMRGEKCRDSCGSFTTTNSYLVTGNSTNSGSPTATVVAGGVAGLAGVAGIEIMCDRDIHSITNGSNGNGNGTTANNNIGTGNSGSGGGGGYQSVATTPESERSNLNCVEDQINIELQPI